MTTHTAVDASTDYAHPRDTAHEPSTRGKQVGQGQQGAPNPKSFQETIPQIERAKAAHLFRSTGSASAEIDSVPTNQIERMVCWKDSSALEDAYMALPSQCVFVNNVN